MDASKLTPGQLDGFSIVERVCSVFSLLGCVVIIGTFCASKSFHKPINRLVFYASFGNMMTNVATLMARTYLSDVLSPGCQFQAFLIQMFMPADAFWTLAMAVNVYLTFYYKFDAQKLRRMEIPYLICCYGIPFVVALTFVFVTNSSQGRMYGNATLWCWISSQWDIWRIAMFYGPVWVVILITFFIYIRAGREIYKKHKQLREFNYSSHHEPEPMPPMDDLYSSSKTTEVYVTTEIVNTHQHPVIDLAPLGRRDLDAPGNARAGVPKTVSIVQPPAANNNSNSNSNSNSNGNGNNNRQGPGNPAYSVTISSNKRPDSLVNGGNNNRESYAEGDIHLPIQGETRGDGRTTAKVPPQEPATPATVKSTGASYRPATSVTPGSRNPANQRMRRRAAYEANSASWSYAKCAILFFTAMLVTWIPSSANRVFSVVHVDEVSVPLEYMSSFVLPLQGFWNAIIYVVTSWKACKTLWNDVVASRLPLGARRGRGRGRSSSGSGSKGRRDQQAAARHSQYQRQSSFGDGVGMGGRAGGGKSGGGDDNGFDSGIPLGAAPGRASMSRSRAIALDVRGGGGAGGRNGFPMKSPASTSSNNSDEMLDKMVGGHGAGSKSEKSYESESITELAVSRLTSRDN
ncbi:cyclic-AMP receptor-like protein [Niveomyces insectorum RCEF 264]|uniref:Cyclic-AMP receptor-like protein n=1 Tax=Niveomyces insectorum RCEF 264 TaxID=1081102 RepID=A0A167PSN1_9HYPO|nr:cyclic-AMP receptor-like protein [Niveomyces insectorum RCEF 264]